MCYSVVGSFTCTIEILSCARLTQSSQVQLKVCFVRIPELLQLQVYGIADSNLVCVKGSVSQFDNVCLCLTRLHDCRCQLTQCAGRSRLTNYWYYT